MEELANLERDRPGMPIADHVLKQRSNLWRNDLAKVIFIKGERLWVKITNRDLKDTELPYTGVIDNDPIVIRMRRGDEIKFGPQHICDIDICPQ